MYFAASLRVTGNEVGSEFARPVDCPRGQCPLGQVHLVFHEFRNPSSAIALDPSTVRRSRGVQRWRAPDRRALAERSRRQLIRCERAPRRSFDEATPRCVRTTQSNALLAASKLFVSWNACVVPIA